MLKLAAFRRRFPEHPAVDLAAVLRPALAALVRRGMSVAVGVGSRGVTRLAEVVRETLDALRAAGASPFIIPAMGSHGGATPEGQRALLAEYGVTEASMGVPVRDSMETVLLGRSPEGIPVHFSAEARRADGVVVLNRVKPHTDFSGPLGSGLQKMLGVGFGKQRGAAAIHAAASRRGLEAVLLAVAGVVLREVPVLAGIALLEDGRHRCARVEVVPGPEIPAREPALLAEANRLMPRLPVERVDVLVVDRIGKNISGAGMDPNVIGRTISGYSASLADHAASPVIHRIIVRDLTPESHGNATGIGLADFTTTRLLRGIDWPVTRMNALTSLSLNAFKIPLSFDTDRECLERALATVPLEEGFRPRVLRIRDTLNLERFEASEALAAEMADVPGVEELAPAREILFDPGGNLLPMES
jgi:hypothetical protein